MPGEKNDPVIVVIRFTKAELYRYSAREFLQFPRVLGFLLPMAGVAFYEIRQQGSVVGSFALAVFFFFGLPALQLLLTRNNPGINEDTQHGFSDSGISTVMGGVSNFGEWSFVTEASENRQYLTVKFKSGAVVLPKNQLRESELAAVRAIIRSHLNERAKLLSEE